MMANSSFAALRNRAKDKMKAGEVVSSMAVRLVQSVEIVSIARSAGFDSIFIDLEHSGFSLQTCNQISVAALHADLPCFVRVPNGTPEYVSRVLDGGALGVIVPDVRSVAEARAVVSAARYAPAGDRGLSGALPQFGFMPTVASLAGPASNAATLVILQIESAEGLAHCEEIIAVDGVDMIFVGANDLLSDLGIPGQFDDPRLITGYERILDACKAAGKFLGVGGLQSRPDLAERLVRGGASFVSGGADIAFLLKAATGKAAEIQQFGRERTA